MFIGYSYQLFDLQVIMGKTELEKLIDTKNLILQSMEVLDEMKKTQKRTDIIACIGITLMITYSVLLVIGFLALMFFL